MMRAIQTYRGDWIVQHRNGVSRPGVFADEQAALDSMYLTEPKLREIYVPMREGGSPLTRAQIAAARP